MTGKYWTEQINPVSGCTPISEACANCYAKGIHERFRTNDGSYNGRFYEHPFSEVTLQPQQLERFDALAKKKAPQVVFIGNMCDLFHPDVPFDYIAGVFGNMHRSKHTFILLTKRAERMKAFIEWFRKEWLGPFWSAWPREYPTVWLGVTAENDLRWAERVPHLLETPAAHRWVSAEPLLGPVTPILGWAPQGLVRTRIDMVIAGGESGPKARPMHGQWVHDLFETCKANGVKVHFKQYSEGDRPVICPDRNKDICHHDERKCQTFEGIDYSQFKPADIWKVSA